MSLRVQPFDASRRSHRLAMLAQAVGIMLLLPLTLHGISWLAKTLGLPASFLSTQAVTLIAVLCVVLLNRSGDDLKKVGFKPLAPSFRNAALILGGTLVILLLSPFWKHVIAPVFGFEYADYTEAFVSHFEGDLGNYLRYMIFVVFLSAGVGEEILARGFLFNRFEKVMSNFSAPWLPALFLQAIVFGLFHYNSGWQAVLETMMSGLVLGVIYLLSGRNLLASIATHILVNSIYITCFYFGRGVFV